MALGLLLVILSFRRILFIELGLLLPSHSGARPRRRLRTPSKWYSNITTYSRISGFLYRFWFLSEIQLIRLAYNPLWQGATPTTKSRPRLLIDTYSTILGRLTSIIRSETLKLGSFVLKVKKCMTIPLFGQTHTQRTPACITGVQYCSICDREKTCRKMGRKKVKEHPIRKFFVYDLDTDISKCTFEGCNVQIKVRQLAMTVFCTSFRTPVLVF